jgi:hypothetical protein
MLYKHFRHEHKVSGIFLLVCFSQYTFPLHVNYHAWPKRSLRRYTCKTVTCGKSSMQINRRAFYLLSY